MFLMYHLKHKLLNFDDIQFIYFFLLLLVLSNHYQIQCHKDLPLFFLLRILALTLKSLSPFELILDMVWGGGLISFSACEYSVVLAPLVEEAILFSSEWSWHPCQKSMYKFTFGSSILFHWSICQSNSSNTLSSLLLLCSKF